MTDSDTQSLLTLLGQSPDAATIVAAATALGARHELLAVSLLLEKLNEETPDVVKAAISALGTIGSPDAIDPLLILAEAKKRYRRPALRATLAIGCLERLDDILATYARYEYVLGKSEAANLAAFADQRALPALVRSTRDHWSDVGIDPPDLKKCFEQVWARGPVKSPDA